MPSSNIKNVKAVSFETAFFVLIFTSLGVKSALVECRVDRVEILRVEVILRDPEGVGETVSMKFFPP